MRKTSIPNYFSCLSESLVQLLKKENVKPNNKIELKKSNRAKIQQEDTNVSPIVMPGHVSKSRDFFTLKRSIPMKYCLFFTSLC